MTPELLARIVALLAALAKVSGDAAVLEKEVAAITAPAQAVTVRNGAELQLALDAAAAGTTIKLDPAGTFAGYFVLPARPGTAVTTITTDGPVPTGRIAPGVPLATLTAPGIGCVVRTAPGAAHYALVGLDIGAVPNGYASLCIGSDEETSLEQFPEDIRVERVRIVAPETATQIRGVMAIGSRITIRDSYIGGIKARGADSQAIWCNGPGPYLIENNYLEAAGENVMCGGSDPKVQGLVPSDIDIRDNLIRKPLAWRTYNAAQTDPEQRYVVKNLLELKNARRVSITGNTFENVWVAGQAGCAILFTPRNQNGRAPWATVEDIIFERNIVRRAACGFSILGTDDERPSQTTDRITIRRNLFTEIGTAYGNGYWMQIGAGARNVSVDHNTIISGGSRGVLMAYGAPMPGFSFTNNIARHDTYGILGDAKGIGTVAITYYFPGSTVTKNVLAGGASRSYPAGNLFPSVTDFTAQFTDPANGDFSLVPTSTWKGAATDGGDLGR